MNTLCYLLYVGAFTITDKNIALSEFVLSCPTWKDVDFEFAWIHNKCYIINRENHQHWKGANAMCKEKGMVFLKHNAQSSIYAFLDYLDRQDDFDVCYWTGVNQFMGETDINTEGWWQWADGSPVRMTRYNIMGIPVFYPEKSLSSAWDENCAAVCRSGLQWTTESKKCESKFGFICQYDPCPVWDLEERGWLEGKILDDKCYSFGKGMSNPATWDDARKLCENNGQTLLRFNSAQDYKTLSRHMVGRTGNKELYWTGLTDRQDEGHWKWTDGTDGGLVNEILMENADLDPDQMDCSAFAFTRSYDDDDYQLNAGFLQDDCRTKNNFICQHDVVPVESTESENTTIVQHIQTTSIPTIGSLLSKSGSANQTTMNSRSNSADLVKDVVPIESTESEKTIVVQHIQTTSIPTIGSLLSTSGSAVDIAENIRPNSARLIKVVRRISSSSRLTSLPAWTGRAPRQPTCARLCQSLDTPCDLFDFNLDSATCRCFLSVDVFEQEPAPDGWSVWQFVSIESGYRR